MLQNLHCPSRSFQTTVCSVHRHIRRLAPSARIFPVLWPCYRFPCTSEQGGLKNLKQNQTFLLLVHTHKSPSCIWIGGGRRRRLHNIAVWSGRGGQPLFYTVFLPPALDLCFPANRPHLPDTAAPADTFFCAGLPVFLLFHPVCSLKGRSDTHHTG